MTDKDKLNKLLELDDASLKARIGNAANAVGADTRQLSYSLNDIGKVRSLISNLTQSDIDRLIASFGKENAEKISKILNSDS